ncbi:MAG TPA: FecR family protein [Candidatus Acidoferrum sp.]
MTSRKLVPSLLPILFVALFLSVPAASADASHARIIRLSLVSGDVRFATETHGDPLTDSKANWDAAQLNLPMRQGYVLATGNGRAEVEFENGTLAFLKENTVLEFYDLSLKDGALITRLVLRQGSASFHVNPVSGDYFSVTGGDFTVEAGSRATFRLDNFDDGSAVENISGHITVLHQDETFSSLEKGQSLSMKAGDSSVKIGRIPEADEFDQWVSGQIDTVSTATAATMQYTSSPYYAAGFGSLYSYGSWSNCGGYGFGWRPFGVGYGWSPFTDGQWIWDPTFGWTFASFQPWGWAPYHYGGWLFDSGCGGWFYSPPGVYGFFPGAGVPIRRFPPRVHPPRPVYHPVTAVFVHNKGNLGFVPMHPLDAKGKTPRNLEHGILSTGASSAIAFVPGEKWETLKSAPKEAFSNTLTRTAPPERVSRTVLESSGGARVVSTSKDSSIAYDPKEHRFVNSNNSSAGGSGDKASRGESEKIPAAGAANHDGNSTVAAAARNVTPPRNSAPRNSAPPPVPRYSGGGERSSAGGVSSGGWGGSRSSGPSSGGGSMHSSPAPASAPASHGSSGGRPH